MKRNFTALLFALLTSVMLFAQKSTNDLAGLQPFNEVPVYTMPSVDNEALLNAELDRREKGTAPKFAKHLPVDINPISHGIWGRADSGEEVWRLRIYSEGAKSLNLGFSKFYMPRGGKLFLYKPKRSELLGPFTPADNEEHEQLWTPVIDGEEIVIELRVPPAEKSNVQLQLKSVNHDFIGFSSMSLLSGSCNLDVICGEADGWGIVDGYRDIIQSVAVISTGGTTFCTGFLVNNVNNDCTPFFMTADHCGIGNNNAASLVAYWNFESPECRQPGSGSSGGNGNGTLNDFNTGAFFRASWSPSDMTLVELDDPVSETADAFFAGFDANPVIPQDTIICIHHPSTDEKRITFEFDPAQPSVGSSVVTDLDDATHLRIPAWDIGTTEPGSSGSPLFNNQKQVVGQLHGGAASCGNASNNNPNDDWDYYGWFNTSWNGGGTPNTALRFWLDPNETGTMSMPGKSCNVTVTSSPNFQSLCGDTDAIFIISTNDGFADSVHFSIPNLPMGATFNFSQNPVFAGESSTLTINSSGVPTGLYPFTIEASDGFATATNNITINLFESAPEMVELALPNNMTTEVSTLPVISWNNTMGNNSSYDIEIATDDAFANIVTSQNGLGGTTYSSGALEVLTTYYWRVRAKNICGDGPWSDTWSFTTADVDCALSSATDTPIEIGDQENEVLNSYISVSENAVISNLRVIDLSISHSYTGDLSATLTSPSGTVVQLFDRAGVPETEFGCDESDIFVSFDDQAMNTPEDFENSCEDNPSIGGVYQSIDPLSAFNNENPTGEWKLTVTDAVEDDGGSINNWQLDFCTIGLPDYTLTPSETSFDNCTGEDYVFTIIVGSDFGPGPVDLSTIGIPSNWTVSYSSNPAMAGETVTVTISDVSTTGLYNIEITANDGNNNATTNVTVTAASAPVASTLDFPMDAATGVTLSPTLEWAATLNTDNYLLEIAADESFDNIVATENTTETIFTVPTALDYNSTYFWRVTAGNDCGTAASETSSFTTELDVAVEEIEGTAFQILPNPSNGNVDIIFAQAIDNDLSVAVYAIDGTLLQQEYYTNTLKTIPVELDYSNGVYVIRLVSDKATVAKRVLLQR